MIGWKRVWFQVHWFIGITAGIVLAVVGLSGAFLSFEEPILRALNPGLVTVVPRSRAALEPAQLIEAVRARNPGRRVTGVSLAYDSELATRVTFAHTAEGASGSTSGRRGETFYVDPYDAHVLGKQRRGEAFLHFMEDVHRRLAAGATGKAIVGAATMLLVVMCLTGLYLRWPQFALRLRAWFLFDFSLKGRPFLWHLHAVLATWALLFYLLAALTGLQWSYGWYRDGLYALTGAPRPSPPGGRGEESGLVTELTGPEIARAWTTFRSQAPQFRLANVNLPQTQGKPVEIRYLTSDAAHERAFDRMALDPASGAVVEHERYADKSLGARTMSSIFVLHSGSFFGLPGTIAMMLASLAMPLFAVTGWMLYLERRRRKRRARAREVERAQGAAPGSESESQSFARSS